LSGSLVFVSGDANNPLKGSDPYVVVLQSIGRGAENRAAVSARASGAAGTASRNGAAAARVEKARGRVPEFVPDEIIVRYKPGVDPGMLAKGPVSTRYAEARSDRNIRRGATSLLRLSGTVRGTLSEKAVRDITLSEIERIKANPYVEYAGPNYIYKLLFTPNDPEYPLQWHYPLVDLDDLWFDDALWTEVQDLSGITVAVIDTGIAGGVDGTHDDLSDTPTLFRDQYDFYNGDADATDESTTYHGTHVTGTIAALTDNATGVAGVAGGSGSGKGARIMPLRALSDTGESFDIAQAVLYAARIENAFSVLPSQKAQIINMSTGGYYKDPTLTNAIKDAYAAGLVIVAAAGNEATDLPIYPAAYPEVISVGAVTPGAEKAFYSNFISGFGGKVDISAPGGSGIGVIDPYNLPSPLKIDLNFDNYVDDVLSTIGNNTDYEYFAGTSMATPHVAGAAALVLRALEVAGDADQSAARVRSILTSTASPLGSADLYGAGLLDVCKAVRTARSASPAHPVLSCSPKTLRLYGSPPQGTFVVTNTGKTQDVGVTLTVLNQSDAGFINDVTPGTATIPSGSSGIYIDVTASPGPFPPSLRYGVIEITSPDAEPERVYVMHKDIGAVYAVVFEVIDFSPFTTVPVTAVTVSPYDGFRFSFGDLATGYYLLGASTDRNGDGLIFDAGEAYGFYGAPDHDNATIVSLGWGDTYSDLHLQVIDWE
jgi:serine protease